MPELPEVETTRLGIEPYLTNQVIDRVEIRFPRLRWPIPHQIKEILPGLKLNSILRRGKFLLLNFKKGTLLIHLGMSGRLTLLNDKTKPQKHDHVDLVFKKGQILRLTDPRRFGAILWVNYGEENKYLKNMGIEPLTPKFTGEYLYKKVHMKNISIKNIIMDGKIVVGVGNIYATEALFYAGINPMTEASKLSLTHYKHLVTAIKRVLRKAIKAGGTTLKDFTKTDGTLGMFFVNLKIYGKKGKPCPQCKTIINLVQLAQRSSYFCPKCQKYKK